MDALVSHILTFVLRPNNSCSVNDFITPWFTHTTLKNVDLKKEKSLKSYNV